MAAVTLPKFSEARDVDEFVAKLEAFERGEIGPDAFRAYRLTRGVYGQRQEGTQMLRVKIPFGRLDETALNALADVADAYSRGFGHVTTRQNVQFHFVKMSDVEAAMRRLDEAGLTTRGACGNSVRSVTACELAEVCRAAPFDVTPYAEAITRLFLRHPLSETLPRKFKIAFSGCANDCAKAAIHDLGFIATTKDGEKGFKVVAGGGLSSSPRNALVLHEWVRGAEIGRVGEAIVRLFDRLGNRENRQRARLKYVLKKLGDDGFRATYAAIRAEVDAEAAAELALPELAGTTPGTPIESADAKRDADYFAWRASSVVSQRDHEHVAVYVRLLLGDATSAQLREIGALASAFGDGTVRLTIDQNLLLPWVHPRSLPALFARLDAAGLAKLDLHTARDVTSCQGADTCNLAVTSSRAVARAITDKLEALGLGASGDVAKTIIKVSGCPNSCGQHHIADLGFHGGAKTIGDTTVPVYQLHLGGGVDPRGARFGRQVVKIVARRVPDAVLVLLRLYEAEKSDGETPAAFFERADAKKVVAALGDIVSAAPRPDEAADVGEASGFLVQLGEGECAA
ncbi:MAG: nitrite/sulfite reductase [Labilithrix sp.]|nr:nitrite/sulfite reductase [Labilithrix sp.]MCW5814492.1 nitrite/sulfite reductase [Labilithrix sp.]